jgi:hypothetical protein
MLGHLQARVNIDRSKEQSTFGCEQSGKPIQQHSVDWRVFTNHTDRVDEIKYLVG